jgi:hypothetical protein
LPTPYGAAGYRRPWWQLDRLHSRIFQHFQEVDCEQRIAIMNEVSLALENSIDAVRQIPTDLVDFGIVKWPSSAF